MHFHFSGSEYVGSWKLNKMHGEGLRRFANGDAYMGSFVENCRSGHGKLSFQNGDLYVGSWKNDKFHGQGKYHYHREGKTYQGSFVDGMRSGVSKVQHDASGILELIRFENNVPQGIGIRWSKDRTKAWRLKTRKGGVAKLKRITIPEAVALRYELEEEAAASSSPTSSSSQQHQDDQTSCRDTEHDSFCEPLFL